MRKFKVELDALTGFIREIDLTPDEIAEAEIRSAAEAGENAYRARAELARTELMNYLMQFVAGRPDAPQSIKDYVGSPQQGNANPYKPEKI